MRRLTPAFAEMVMAGIVTQSLMGARLASERLTVDDFHSPALGMVFSTAISLDGHDLDERILAVDDAVSGAGYKPSWRSARHLTALTWCLSDASGVIAAAVKANAEIRRLETRVAEAKALAQVGSRGADVLDLLRAAS